MELGTLLDNFPNSIINRRSNEVQVGLCESTNVDTSRLEHVNVVISPNVFHLWHCQASVAKHSNLLRHMPPLSRSSQFFQPLPQPRPHPLDPPSHGLNTILPLLEVVRVIECHCHDSRSVLWGIGVHPSDEQSYLG